jgi:hypothetical protein
MKKLWLGVFLWVLFFLVLGSDSRLGAASIHLHHPIYELKVKSSFLDNSRLTLMALDSNLQEDASVNGAYPVEINGFEHSLHFILGRSQFPGSLKNSTFISLKPLSKGGSKPVFYFLWRWGAGIYPQNISVFWLIGIPLIFVLIGFLFRKLIIFLMVLALIFFFFNKGLDPLHFLKVLGDWIVYIFHKLQEGLHK